MVVMSMLCFGKDEPIRISTVTDISDATSAEVMKLFRQKVGDHGDLFKLVETSDSGVGLLFTEDCMPRKAPADLYSCYYTTHYVGGTFKTFMGGGIYVGKTASEMADNFVAAVAQDIVERWSDISRSNSIEMLESCLFLTQSNCAVPERLAPELKTKVLNLSQYLQKGGLRK
jgi:hypothetical protein